MEKLRPELERAAAVTLAESIEAAIFAKVADNDREYSSKCREIRQNLTNRQVRGARLAWARLRGRICRARGHRRYGAMVPKREWWWWWWRHPRVRVRAY